MDDYDARLVELYNDDNPDGSDHEFYRQVADEIGARAILDVGCGTGILMAAFARADRMVVGIDPSPNMLAYATNRANGRSVRWILGDSRDMPPEPFDYAVMTGNVAQHILDIDWERTLTNISGALRDGGVLAFESRNPQSRAWEKWANAEPTIRDTANGPLREWCEVSETDPGRIVLTAHC
jgi:SAM-dependent methyltransferase